VQFLRDLCPEGDGYALPKTALILPGKGRGAERGDASEWEKYSVFLLGYNALLLGGSDMRVTSRDVAVAEEAKEGGCARERAQGAA
jgi:hypothetical protein